MNFKVFMAKLLPSFGKRTLTGEINQINDKLKSFTIPAYATLDKTPFDSNTAKYFESLYSKQVTRGNMYVGILSALRTSLELGEYLDDQVEATFNDDITRASLTAYMVNTLKLIQVIDFVSDYARRLCRYLATTAINKQGGVSDELQGIVTAEKNFIEDYKYAFFDALKILNAPVKDIKRKLESIPKIIITPDNLDSVGAAVGVNNIDPLALNFISTRFNPALFFGTKVARYQANKYNQAKLDLQEIQCKILKLKQARSDKHDAKLDKQIEYYENLNNKVHAEIEDMEEDYGIS